MQTFLPYSNFKKTARCLDLRRLGKQRIEARQILGCILNPNGWRHHPVVKQWSDYPKLLCFYGMAICDEWINIGCKDNQKQFFEEMVLSPVIQEEGLAIPEWLGQEDFHSRHRSRLLAKDPEWYSQFGWKEVPDVNAWTFAVPPILKQGI